MSDDRVERALAEIAGGDSALSVERVHARAQQRRRRSIARRSGAGLTAVALAVGGWAIVRDDDGSNGPDVEVIDEPDELSDQLAIVRSDHTISSFDVSSGAASASWNVDTDAGVDDIVGVLADGTVLTQSKAAGACPMVERLARFDPRSGGLIDAFEIDGHWFALRRDDVLAYSAIPCDGYVVGWRTLDDPEPLGSYRYQLDDGRAPPNPWGVRPLGWSADGRRIATAVLDVEVGDEWLVWLDTGSSQLVGERLELPRDGEYSTDVDGNLFAVANTSEMGLSLLELDNETFEVTDTLVELPPGIAGDLSVDASRTKFAIVIIDAEARSALYTWQRGDTEVRKLLDEVESAAWLRAGAPAPAPTTTTEPTTSTPRTSPERPLFAVRDDGMLVEMSVDGSIVREFRLLPTDLYSLAVTPDRKTAYYTQDGDGCANAFSLSLATPDAEPEFLGLARQLELSDDGRFLALSRYSPGGAAEQQCTDVPPVAWAVEVQDRETDSSVYFEEPNVDGSGYPASAGHLSFDPSGQFLAVEVCFEGCHVAVLIHFNGGLELLEAPTFDRLGQLPVFVDQSQVYVYECTCFEDVGDAEIVRRATDHWNDDGRFANLNDPLDDGAMIGDHVPIAMSVVSATQGDDRLFVLFDDGRLVAFGPDGRGTVLDGGYVAITSQGQVTDE